MLHRGRQQSQEVEVTIVTVVDGVAACTVASTSAHLARPLAESSGARNHTKLTLSVAATLRNPPQSDLQQLGSCSSSNDSLVQLAKQPP